MASEKPNPCAVDARMDATPRQDLETLLRDGQPDWHHYSYMFPVTHQASTYGIECAFNCPHYRKRGGKQTYARGDCPVADDLYDRMIAIDLNQYLTARDCQRIANGITKVLDAYCTPDPKGARWF